MNKVGRFTAVLLFLTVATFLLLDLASGSNYLGLAFDWWPVALIALGAEFSLFRMFRRKEGGIRFDLAGLFLSVLITFVIVALAFRLNLNASFSVSSPLSGYKIEKGVTSVPIGEQTQNVVIENVAGSVSIKPGNVESIQIDTTIWVDSGKTEAERVANASRIAYKEEGGILKITVAGEPYGPDKNRPPTMNLQITVPEKRKVDMQLQLNQGGAEVVKLPIKNRLTITASKGNVTVSDIGGNVTVHTTDSNAKVANIKGDAELEAANGSITANDIQGTARLHSTHGTITGDNMTGNVTANTSDASIRLSEVRGKVNAVASNGGIRVTSSTVGGEWDLGTSKTKLEIDVPAHGDFRIEGSTVNGSIKSELPLDVTPNSIKGTIGSGNYLIRLKTVDGGIAINQAH